MVVCRGCGADVKKIFLDLGLSPISNELISHLEKLRSEIDSQYLLSLLNNLEVEALFNRIDSLIEKKQYPLPSEDWPAIPWPPF